MPIEDINFLYENSVKENMVILVDSNHRDRDLFPSAAEFDISFDEPINFIYGIDILDTTIPRTMFMMDYNNNQIILRYGFDMLSITENTKFNFLPQDFSSASTFFQRIESQLGELNFSLNNYDNVYLDTDFMITNYSNRLLNDHPIRRFVRTTPFMFDMLNSSTFNIFGFDKNTTVHDYPKYVKVETILNSSLPVNINLTDSTSFKEVAVNYEMVENGIKILYKHTPDYSVGSFLQNIHIINNKSVFNTDIYLSILDEIDNVSVTTINRFKYIINNQSTVVIKKFSKLNDDFGSKTSHIILRKNHTYTFLIDTPDDCSDLSIYISYAYNIKLQNFEWNKRTFISKTIYDAKQQIVVDPTYTNLNITNIASYKSISFPFQYNSIIFDKYNSISEIGTLTKIEIEVQRDDTQLLNNTFILSLLYEDVAIADIELKYSADNDKYTLKYINDNIDASVFNFIVINFNNADKYSWRLYVQKSINVLQSIDNTVKHRYEYIFFNEFGIVSPGIINLASENYIILRCPEIENHLLGSYNSNHNVNPGLAVMNIDVQGYASGKSEFFGVKYKEFHPIGRLNKLRFRFERKSDRKLYDFKNIDLHFLMSIKYLAPKQKNMFVNSILNPNYSPNYHEYVNNEFSSSESEIDENEYNEKERTIMQYFNKYN
jgi:hypothetical protein